MNFLTVHIPILHGHVDDDLVGLDVVLHQLWAWLDWSNHWEPTGLLFHTESGPSFLNLKIRLGMRNKI